MPDNGITRVKVLVASPGDVSEERNIAVEVIRDWHSRHPGCQLMLDPVLWEKRSAPESKRDGGGVQEVLNHQIVDDCDCAVGIFWTRIGTPTKVAPGGAVEEVERMLKGEKPVMLYFSNVPIARSKVDKAQEAKLDEFRASLKADSLVWEYDERHEFREKLARHLDINIPRWFPACYAGAGSGDSVLLPENNTVETLHSSPAALETEPPTVVTVYSKPKLFHNKHEEEAEYIRIAGGSYIYSVTGKEVQVEEFSMAKYPVTNRLYRRFIAFLEANSKDRGGQVSAPSIREELRALAKRDLWWPKLGDYLHEGKNDLAVLFRSTLDAEPKFNGDDQPVVGITWYAARAYCLWLSLLESSGRDSTLYRLPTEVEWEWAAGGQRGAKVQRVRQWPWSEDEGELSVRLANYYDSKIGATTPVGSYPDGATPEGLHDMAGNVWEWMDNWYEEKEAARSLRGGSWGSGSEFLRCSFRFNGYPGGRLNCIGFRVVRSSRGEKFFAPAFD